MKFLIEESLLQKFSPVVRVIVARGLDNTGAFSNASEIQEAMRKEEERIRTAFAAEGALAAYPAIAAWRKAYKAFGADSYRCSAEALARRILKGDSVPSINTLVDLYNLISVRHLLPVGGEDLDVMQGDLSLGFCDGSEAFVRIGGSENEPPLAGEVAYKDALGVVCRRWNWREADRTKLTEKTVNAIIVVDGLAEIGLGTVNTATNELAALIEKHCGGELTKDILDRDHTEMTL